MTYDEIKKTRSKDTDFKCPYCSGVLFTWGEMYPVIDPKVIHECRDCGSETTIRQSEIDKKEKDNE